MVQSYCKDYVKDGGSFNMPQLILRNGLHLQVQIPEHGTTRAGRQNEEAKMKRSRSSSL